MKHIERTKICGGGAKSPLWKKIIANVMNLKVDVPENVTIVGGKTGTTDEAGYCLILMEKDSSDNPYISIVMGASEKPVLYEDMTSLIEAIPSGQQ